MAVGIPLLMVPFVLLPELNEEEHKELIDNFIRGYDEGVKEALLSLYEETENCRVAPIFIENKTKNLIDFSCLNHYSDAVP